jgi:hypothetical protein
MNAESHVTDRPPVTGPDTFRRQGYCELPRLIEPALSAFFWSYVRTKFASLLLTAGDRQVPHTPSGYGDPAFDGLLEYLCPRIETHSGLLLYPTYSYFRLYKRGDVLRRHRDRPACEISISLNVGQMPSEPWPIYVERDAGPHAALLMPGDALLYRGIDCFHWREAFQGDSMVQVFLHYVDRNGPHADQKFDRRKTLMRPAEQNQSNDNQSE